jgi:hypothetical protein
MPIGQMYANYISISQTSACTMSVCQMFCQLKVGRPKFGRRIIFRRNDLNPTRPSVCFSSLDPSKDVDDNRRRRRRRFIDRDLFSAAQRLFVRMTLSEWPLIYQLLFELSSFDCVKFCVTISFSKFCY